jgi:hypothetical protein
VWQAKDLLDTLLENSLHVCLKFYLSELYSFYSNVSRVYDLDSILIPKSFLAETVRRILRRIHERYVKNIYFIGK